MITKPFRHHPALAAFPFMFVLVFSGCGSDETQSDSTTGVDKAKFCESFAAIDADMVQITSAEEAVAALTAHSSDLESMLATAPADIAAEAAIMVTNSQTIISTGDVESVAADTEKFDAAQAKVSEYCS